MFTIKLNSDNDNKKYSFDFQHNTHPEELLDAPKINGVNIIAMTACEVSRESEPNTNIFEEKIITEKAWCSELDKFDKSIGRKVSLTRCLNKLQFTKQEREQIWQKYFSMVKK